MMDSLSKKILTYLKSPRKGKEANDLEKMALSDPFLYAALEGLENENPDLIDKDLSFLQNKLNLSKNASYGIYLSVAASVSLLLVGIWYFSFNTSKDDTPLAENTTRPVTTLSRVSSLNTLDSTLALLDEKTKTKQILQKKTTEKKPLDIQSGTNESIGISISSLPTAAVDSVPYQAGDLAMQKESEDVLMSEQADSDVFLRTGNETSSQPIVAEQFSISKKAKYVTGKVYDMENNTLTGINVRGQNGQSTLTNTQGEFDLQLYDTKEKIQFRFIGLEPFDTVFEEGSDVVVRLKDDVESLSEVVLTGYGYGEENEIKSEAWKEANPLGGKKAYKDYINSQIKRLKEKQDIDTTGTVLLELTLSETGEIEFIEVLKSLTDAYDQEAIRLIQSGPTWEPASRGNTPVADKVRIRIKF